MSKKNTDIPKEELRFALYYILKHKTGYTDALNVINEDMSEYLNKAGFISLGVDAAAHGRYRKVNKMLKYYILLCVHQKLISKKVKLKSQK